jgi:hypothetical protein
MENNKTSVLLNEGALQKFISAIFGKNFKSTIGAAAEVLLNKALNDVVKSGRKFSINTLRKTPEYAQALKQLTEEACRVKHKMSFNDLVKVNKNEALKLIDDVQDGMAKQLEETAATTKGLSAADVKAAKGNVRNVTKDAKSTVNDLRGANKDLQNATKLESTWGETQKAISKMDKIKLGKVQKILSQQAKVTTGTGSSIAKGLGNNVVIKTMKGIFKTTKEALKNFPGKIKKVIVNNKMLSALTAAGLGATALYYFYNSTDDTSVVLVDENGNPLEDSSKTNWGPCLTDLLALKEAKLAKSPKGEISVFTPASEKYPSGLNFYSNGRVMNNQTKEMGRWTCTAGQAAVNENMSKNKLNESIGQIVKRVLNERYLIEQSASQIDSDVEDMIDYLDVPVWGNDYKNIYNLLKKYGSNGKFNEFKEIYEESGFMKTSLRSDISTIYAIDASSVRMKKQILSLLDQIESGKYVQAPPTPTTVPSTTTTTNTNTGQRKPQKTVINEDNKLDIVWDKDKAGGGNTTRKTYYDCTNVNLDTTALTYGCKDSRIAQIQGCLGVTPDGKFGPATRKSLLDDGFDVKNGITKDIFNKVLSMCKTSKVGEMSDEDKARVNYLKTPIKLDLGPVPQMPAKNDSSNFIQPTDTVTKTLSPTNESGQNFYNRLEGNGNFEDGKFGKNRARYKGNNLNDEDLGKLDEFFRANGYDRERGRIDKPYGEKYVWIKQ